MKPATPAAAPKHAAEPSAEPVSERLLGQGRSGAVYLGCDAQQRPIARKVFASSGLTKWVQVLFLGAPNPYAWNRHAARCAFLRRRILAQLVPFWSAERMSIAAATDLVWNAPQGSFELQAEFIDGRPAPLHHPLRNRGSGIVRKLWNELMPELAHMLEQSGFDGLTWQAGRGNPVALNNFLFNPHVEGPPKWVWIDLESGVPALFPLDVRTLWRYYLPRSRSYGRPLFDDVNCWRLQSWLLRNRERLLQSFAQRELRQLSQWTAELADEQAHWKRGGRFGAAIQYRLAKGDLDASQAQYYSAHRTRFALREFRRLCKSGLQHLRLLPGKLQRRWQRLELLAGLKGALNFVRSSLYRKLLARRAVAARIRRWEERAQVSPMEAEILAGHLEDESSSYLTDFGVHLAIKPPLYAVEWWLAPGLAALGVINPAMLPLIWAAAGPITRTLYTGGRLLQSLATGRERPWIALIVGTLPVIGNLAYPVQLVYSSTGSHQVLAQFILYDGFAWIGRKVPIFGGADTLLEHAFNRLPDHLVGLRKGK